MRRLERHCQWQRPGPEPVDPGRPVGLDSAFLRSATKAIPFIRPKL